MPHNSTLTLRHTAALLAAGLAASTVLAAAPVTAAGASAEHRVVVTALSGDVAAAASAVRAAGGRILDRIPLIGGVTASLPAGTVLAPAYRVAPDRPLSVAAARDRRGDNSDGNGNGNKGGAGKAGSAVSGAGNGITVAVVDTGVADVADLGGRVTHLNVSGRGSGDGFGHGTFVAGLVAGDGTSSQGKHTGVAPGASVLDVRVADAQGNSNLITVLRGLQAVANYNENHKVSVLNLSLASGSPLPYQIDPLSSALEALWNRGVTVVVPSGNDPDQVSSPGNDPVLLTLGALEQGAAADHSADTVVEFSGRGPAAQGVAKPDLVATGSHVVSLRAPGSVIDSANPGSRVDGSYFRGSGTSFSTAVASGAVAVLLSQRPGLTPDQVKALLTATAYQAPGLADRRAAGAGGLDLAKALAAPTPADPGNTSVQVPGDPELWATFLSAVISGDRKAAASSWSRLSPEARNWAASSWSSLSFEARNWAARNWAGRDWAGADGTAEEWAARNWAARNWAASSWSASSWSARNWAARNWAASSWSASSWSDDDWAARNWAASSWSARNWAGIWR
ncbi:MAG: aprX [Frankiales bacterium]|nr:aprX [Frankiales bacterium]